MAFEITLGNFINDVIHVVDEVTGRFIESGYKAIVSHWITSGMLTSILALYVTYFFYQVKFQDMPLSEASNHLIKVCAVFTLATSWDVFYILIFNVVTNEPLAISDALMSKATGTDGSLNSIFAEGTKSAFEILKNMSFTVKGVVLGLAAAALLLVATGLFTIIALGLIVISKFYLAVLLAIAPYFIMMHLFNCSKGLTEAWAKDVLNKMLIPVFVSCVLLLTSTLAKACLYAAGQTTGKTPDFSGIVAYLCCGIISLSLFRIIPEKTASLTSSLAIAGAGKMLSNARESVNKVAQAGQNFGKGAKNAASDFRQRRQNQLSDVRARAEARHRQAEGARAQRSRMPY